MLLTPQSCARPAAAHGWSPSAMPARSRPAFTLLEVLLAMAISLVLMAALYAALSIELRHSQAGRDVIEGSTLVRASLDKIGRDINTCVGPLRSTASSSGSSGASNSGSSSPSSSTGSSTSAGTASSPSGGTSSGTTSAAATSSSSATSSTTTSTSFNFGVQGDADQLVLYVSQQPREVYAAAGVDPSTLPLVSDQRRITYWLAGGAGSPLGLARQEVKLVSSDPLMSVMPPGIPDEASFVIAEEVKSLSFRYYDGSSWQTSWDGSTPGPDGVTPQGPPVAVEITVGVAAPGSKASARLKEYVRVVAIPTAAGPASATTTTSGTTP